MVFGSHYGRVRVVQISPVEGQGVDTATNYLRRRRPRAAGRSPPFRTCRPKDRGAPGCSTAARPTRWLSRAPERTLHMDADDRTDLVAMRLASDFVGPVPVAPLDDPLVGAAPRPQRRARRGHWSQPAGATACRAGCGSFVIRRDRGASAPPLDEPTTIPDDACWDSTPSSPTDAASTGRFVSGTMRKPGPAAAWARPRFDAVRGL